jgi:hypothetical protein
VHAPTEDKIDGMKASFTRDCVFDQFQMKILLGYFNSKAGMEDIVKPTIGNESFHKISSDNRVRVVNFTRLKKSVKNNNAPTSLTFKLCSFNT